MLGVGLAFALWSFTFLTGYMGSFWYRVTFSAIVLSVYAFIADREMMLREIRGFSIGDLLKGALGGIVLYTLFYVGYSVLRSLLEGGASNVYLFRLESPTIIIASSLVLTSFCEEYFWRAYVQRRLTASHGGTIGVFATTLAYALIHVPTMNAPLILAASIAGLFWGLVYHRTGSLWLVVASHLAWTELIFVVLPLG
jgi:membrane protease YdiL (CAAX protease family)